MAKIRLTPGRMRSLTTDKAQEFFWDTDTKGKGLGLRVSRAGTKGFVFQGWIDGEAVRCRIGGMETWDLDGARKEARRLQTLIDQGKDPRIEKAAKRAANTAKRKESERQTVIIADAWGLYIEARRSHWGDRYYRDHVNLSRSGGESKKRGNGKTTPGPLAPLMPIKLSELTAAKVRSWLKQEAETRPTQARQAFGALRTFLAWCDDQPAYRGLAGQDACTTRISRQELPKKAAKDDVLQREQLPAWFSAVHQLGNPVISAYLQVLLLTGARREEIAGLAWTNLDFQWSSMTIRDKVDGERTIPLTPYVAALLNALPRRNEWVFSSPTAESGRLQEPRIAHNRALTAGGLPPLSLHGLRRSFGTLSEWVEVPTGVVAQIMGHKPSATAEKHYRRPLDLLRKWHTKLEGWILDEAGIVQPAVDQPTARLRQVS